MAKRRGSHSHYEIMFENFLRNKQLLYIAINEAKRPIYKGERVKNFDFIVVTKKKRLLLVDIKGKQFPYESKYGKNYWENWVQMDDGKYLKKWAKIFKSVGIIVFPYLVKFKNDKRYFKNIFKFKKATYGIVAIEINDYIKHAKPRSRAGKGKFNAISISRKLFSNLVKPISAYLN